MNTAASFVWLVVSIGLILDLQVWWPISVFQLQIIEYIQNKHKYAKKLILNMSTSSVQQSDKTCNRYKISTRHIPLPYAAQIIFLYNPLAASRRRNASYKFTVRRLWRNISSRWRESLLWNKFKYLLIRDLRFSQLCLWGFKFSGIEGVSIG